MTKWQRILYQPNIPLGKNGRRVTACKAHIELSKRYGIEKDSVILLEQVRTIDKSRLREKVCHLDQEILSSVNQALLISFALDT